MLCFKFSWELQEELWLAKRMDMCSPKLILLLIQESNLRNIQHFPPQHCWQVLWHQYHRILSWSSRIDLNQERISINQPKLVLSWCFDWLWGFNPAQIWVFPYFFRLELNWSPVEPAGMRFLLQFQLYIL